MAARTAQPKKKTKLNKFVGRDKIEAHLSRQDRTYRFLFFLSFSLNVIWLIIFLFMLYWFYTPASDNVIINSGIERYCNPNGKVAQFYENNDAIEPKMDVWHRVCKGPSASSANE